MSTRSVATILVVVTVLMVLLACSQCNGEPETVVVTVYVTPEVSELITVTPEAPAPVDITDTPEPPARSELLITFEDQFNDDLNVDEWIFDTNSGGSSYQISDGSLQISSGTTNGGGAWVLSSQLFTPGELMQVFEARVRVTSSDGGNWGFWGDNHEGYLMFGVSENGQFQAMVMQDSSGPLQTVDIYGIDITQWHTYRIEFDNGSAAFYVDDVIVAVHTTNLPVGQNMHIRLDRVSWGQNETNSVDFVRVGTYY